MKVKSFTVNTDNAKDFRDCSFSNGQRYLVPQDRGYTDSSQEEYHSGFSDHDRLLDNAIERGKDLHLGCNLWRIYDDAVDNYGLSPLDPYDWLFKHSTLSERSIVISKPQDRILLVYGLISMEYYDFIHGDGACTNRYSRPIN